MRIFSEIFLRIPRIGIRSSGATAPLTFAAPDLDPPPDLKFSTSSRRTLPFGPLPFTLPRSIPFSLASLRVDGEARTSAELVFETETLGALATTGC